MSTSVPVKANGIILFYIDNSNFYISTQRYGGRVKNFLQGISDTNCRYKAELLIDIIVRGRNVHVQRAYGIITQAVADAMRRKGVEVRNSPNSIQTGREKEADTQLTAESVEDIINKAPEKGNPNNDTVVLLSGDQDMCPMIKMARKYGWNVEVWSYSDSLATAIKTEKERKVDGTVVIIKDVDKEFDNFAHSDHQQWKNEIQIPTERTLIIKFLGSANLMNELDSKVKTEIEESVAKECVKIFRLPFATKFLESFRNDAQLAIVVTISQSRKDNKKVYDFKNYIYPRRGELQKWLENFLRGKFGGSNSRVDIGIFNTAGGGENAQNVRVVARDRRTTGETAQNICKYFAAGTCRNNPCRFIHAKN